jgi:tetratricopeptide (TPR) repeat protein
MLPLRLCPTPPPSPDYFAGRDIPLAELTTRLKNGFTTAIVAVAGLGGIGKTTLARKVVNDLYDQKVFRSVLWAEVGQEPQPLILLENWARYADPSFQADRDRPIAAIALQVKAMLEDVITEKCQECQPQPSLNRTLVVIDDVWGRESSIAATRILKQACPANATVLITSRSQKVANTLGAKIQTIDKLNATEALDLLSQYLPGSNLDQLKELGQILGGHPLALKLAVTRISNAENPNKALEVHLKEYATKLPQGVAFEHLELDQAQDREDSLTLVLSYSYQELKAPDQARFRALGAMAYDQPFDKEMLAALWQLEGAEKVKELEAACDVLRLASLLELEYNFASVSESDSVSSTDKVWYRQHPLLHTYAHALLLASKEAEIIVNRYHQYVTEIITAKFLKLEPEEWSRDLNPYLPHIFSVGNNLHELFQQLGLSVNNSETATASSNPTATPIISTSERSKLKLIQLFAINISWYLSLRLEEQHLDWLEMGLVSSRILADPREEARFLDDIGSIYWAIGEKGKALEYFEQALPLQRAVGDKRGEAATITNMGSVYDDLGEKGKALEYYQQALPIRRAIGDKRGEAITLSNTGSIYDDLGEKGKALEYFEQTLPLFRAVGDKRGEAVIVSNMGGIYSELGEKDKALEYLGQALPLQRAVGNRGGEANTLNNIGGVYYALGEQDRTLEYLGQALSLVRAVGDRRVEAVTLSNMGNVYYALGEQDRTLEYFEQALTIYRAVGDRRGEAITSYSIASIYYETGQLAQAIEYLARCVELDKQVQRPDLASDQALLHKWQQELAGKPPQK